MPPLVKHCRVASRATTLWSRLCPCDPKQPHWRHCVSQTNVLFIYYLKMIPTNYVSLWGDKPIKRSFKAGQTKLWSDLCSLAVLLCKQGQQQQQQKKYITVQKKCTQFCDMQMPNWIWIKIHKMYCRTYKQSMSEIALDKYFAMVLNV